MRRFFALLGVFGFLFTGAASAYWRLEYAQVTDQERAWFKAQRSPQGVPCCDIADGHQTDEQLRLDGYWALVDNEWLKVPPEAVIHVANPTGRAVIWYVSQGGDKHYVRCFVPQAEG